MKHAVFEELRARDATAFGGWMVTDNERALEGYRKAGFDYVGLDCQHTLVGVKRAAEIVRHYAGEQPLVVRSPSNSLSEIGMLLDAGADGVIVPGVNTAAEAAAAVSAFRYPPSGVRSWGPVLTSMGRDPRVIEARALALVMVETAQGLAEVEEIAATPGLDGIYVGPADLSIALGLPVNGAFSTDQLDQAFGVIAAACERNGLILGTHATGASSAAHWQELGCRFLSVGGDVGIFDSAAAALYDSLPGARPVRRTSGGGPYG